MICENFLEHLNSSEGHWPCVIDGCPALWEWPQELHHHLRKHHCTSLQQFSQVAYLVPCTDNTQDHVRFRLASASEAMSRNPMTFNPAAQAQVDPATGQLHRPHYDASISIDARQVTIDQVKTFLVDRSRAFKGTIMSDLERICGPITGSVMPGVQSQSQAYLGQGNPTSGSTILPPQLPDVHQAAASAHQCTAVSPQPGSAAPVSVPLPPPTNGVRACAARTSFSPDQLAAAQQLPSSSQPVHQPQLEHCLAPTTQPLPFDHPQTTANVPVSSQQPGHLDLPMQSVPHNTCQAPQTHGMQQPAASAQHQLPGQNQAGPAGPPKNQPPVWREADQPMPNSALQASHHLTAPQSAVPDQPHPFASLPAGQAAPHRLTIGDKHMTIADPSRIDTIDGVGSFPSHSVAAHQLAEPPQHLPSTNPQLQQAASSSHHVETSHERLGPMHVPASRLSSPGFLGTSSSNAFHSSGGRPAAVAHQQIGGHPLAVTNGITAECTVPIEAPPPSLGPPNTREAFLSSAYPDSLHPPPNVPQEHSSSNPLARPDALITREHTFLPGPRSPDMMDAFLSNAFPDLEDLPGVAVEGHPTNLFADELPTVPGGHAQASFPQPHSANVPPSRAASPDILEDFFSNNDIDDM